MPVSFLSRTRRGFAHRSLEREIEENKSVFVYCIGVKKEIDTISLL
jgi:hypothetical protein